MPKCFKCKQVIANINALKIHFQNKHKADVFHNYQCGETSCCAFFKTWAQLRRHINRYHKVATNFDPLDIDETEEIEVIDDVDSINSDIEVEEEIQEPVLVGKDLKVELCAFLMEFIGKLYADPTLPRSYVQIMVDEIRLLVSKIIVVVKPTIVSAMQKDNIEHMVIVKVVNMFDIIDSCFDTFVSEYLRIKHLKDQGCLLEPVRYTIGYGMRDRKKHGQMVKEIVPMTGEFIPLRKLLKMFFSLPGVFDECYSYMGKLEKETNVLSNFVQGSLWRNKKLLHYKDKIVFPLFIYFDDLEVNNPLGSHKTVSKLGATYVTIPCMPPEYRSKLENIFLALIFYSLDRSSYGNKNVFRILVDEINYLQRSGIVLNIDGSQVRVYFALGLILGDNLALNGILGFVESFKANYFCRFCKTHRNETYTCCSERPESLRDVIDYERDVASLTEDSGVKEKSIWNEIDYFHVYENYCSDPLLHELAEGVGKRAMSKILSHYIHETKIFTLNCVNQRLNTFNYRDNGITNRPPVIASSEFDEKKKIYMSGSEMLNFISIFGLLVGDMVPVGDSVWHFYLVLRQIQEIVAAFDVHREYINHLRSLVSEYNKLYIELFKKNIPPKEHIMTHWPLTLEKSGPLSLISVMRMEAKNRLFSLRANATTSRTNIVYTTAFKEQLQVSFRLASKRGLVCNIETGPATYSKEANEECLSLIGHGATDVSSAILDTCVEVPWVDVKGTCYKIGMCVALSHDEFDYPIFGDVLRIFCSERNEVYLFCNILYTSSFDEHFHAYEVHDSNKYILKSQKELLSFRPVIHTFIPSKESRYACMK